MAKISDNYLYVLEQYMVKGFKLKSMSMSAEQKLRTMIVSQAYAMYLQNEDADLSDLVRRASVLVYDNICQTRESHPMSAEIAAACHITDGKKRTHIEMANDVKALDHIIGLFSSDTFNADKRAYRNSARWLIEYGKKTGNDRAVASGADRLANINNNFQKGDEIAEQIASAERVITSDVSVIIPGRENLTDEERESLNKRFGAVGGVVDMKQNADGVFVSPDEYNTPRYEGDYEREEAERDRLKDNFDHLNDRMGYGDDR